MSIKICMCVCAHIYIYIWFLFKYFFLGFDVCGLYEPPPITYSTDINVRRVQTFLNSVCIDHKSKVLPANKAYTSFDSRLRTFKNCKTIINQPVRTLCDAGLLYIGKLCTIN